MSRASALGDLYPPNSFGNSEFHLGNVGVPGASALRLGNSPRASINLNRKRALSSSPYSDALDVSQMIRCSPNSLYGSRNSNVSGSFGHMSATALSNDNNTGSTIGPGTPMSTSSIPSTLQDLLRSGGLLPSLPGHYISPSSSMFSLAHHHSIVTPMQVDSSMSSLNKSVSLKFKRKFSRAILIHATFTEFVRAAIETTVPATSSGS